MYVKRLISSTMKIRAFVNDLAKLFVILVVMNMEMNLGNVVRVHLPFLFHTAKGNSSVEEYKIWKRLLKLYAHFLCYFHMGLYTNDGCGKNSEVLFITV